MPQRCQRLCPVLHRPSPHSFAPLSQISNVVGCLYVDSKSLRNDLLPITLNTLDKIKLLLLNMSRETCLQVLENVQHRIALLQVRMCCCVAAVWQLPCWALGVLLSP